MRKQRRLICGKTSTSHALTTTARSSQRRKKGDMSLWNRKGICWTVGVLLAVVLTSARHGRAEPASSEQLDAQLTAVLASHGFTGMIESKFQAKLDRPIDSHRAELGRLLWF